MIAGCQGVEFEDWSLSPISYQFINMKTDSTRRQLMQRQFETAGLSAEVIEAVVGRDLTSQQIGELIKNKIIDKEVIERKSLTPGQIGCYLSHLQIAISRASKAKDGEIVMTFEDDVSIPPDLEHKFRTALKQIPSDWDILYLGCNQNTYFDVNSTDGFDPYFPKRSLEPRHYVAPTCPIKAYQKVTGTPWIQLDANCVAGTWAFGLHSRSAQKLEKALIPVNEALDFAIKRLVGRGEIRAYCLSPELVSVDLSTSSTKPDEWRLK